MDEHHWRPTGAMESGVVEKKSSCCHGGDAETTGVDNEGFEPTSLAYTPPDPHHCHSDHGNHSHAEEIGLEGLNYHKLCSCEEEGKKCACRDGGGPRKVVQFEPWGKCKCILLSIFIGLTCIWLVVFLSLHFTDII